MLKYRLIFSLLLGFTNCSTAPYDRIENRSNPACIFLTTLTAGSLDVDGGQEALAQGGILYRRANAIGGNYVQIETIQSVPVLTDGRHDTAAVVYTANVYRCPRSD